MINFRPVRRDSQHQIHTLKEKSNLHTNNFFTFLRENCELRYCVAEINVFVEFQILRESAREITSAHVEKHSVFFIRREYTIDAKIKNT